MCSGYLFKFVVLHSKAIKIIVAMKRITLLLLILSSFTFSIAQSYLPEDLIKFKQDTVDKVYVSKIKSNQVYIPLDFNSSAIKDLSAYREVRYNSILKVELVYSGYQKADVFSQPALNTERLEVLQKTAPELFENSLTKWKFIAQTACKTEDEARGLFHGFIITYRPEMPMTDNSSQVKNMRHTVNKYIDPNYDKIVKKVSSTNAKRDVMDTDIPPALLNIQDSVVLTVLNRHKEWKDIPIVCDVTGSMYPYMAQTLIWFKLNSKATNARAYTFFNDGDNKPDTDKVMGKTGGVYTVASGVYDTVENVMCRAMQKGSGGDAPENNIEALLKTIKQNPDCKEVVMIADNYANVKDIGMLPLITKPVRIILCGSKTGINAQYLNIARATGGSIHTMEQDITNLVELNEGEVFNFRGQQFKVVKGQFKLVYGA